MDALAFEHHLTSPQGQGHRPGDGFSATAGGGPAVTRSPSRSRSTGDRVTDAGFEASGCGAASAAASAAVTLLRGAGVLEAARIGPAQIADELGGLSMAKRHAADLAADALARALGAAVRARAELAAAAGGRTLVAMSGGVDSAVAAHLVAERGRGGRGDPRAVGGSRERRREQLLLGLGRRPGPRARPRHGAAPFHRRPARGVPGRRGRAVHRRVRGR